PRRPARDPRCGRPAVNEFAKAPRRPNSSFRIEHFPRTTRPDMDKMSIQLNRMPTLVANWKSILDSGAHPPPDPPGCCTNLSIRLAQPLDPLLPVPSPREG